jgi:hypothetical protein
LLETPYGTDSESVVRSRLTKQIGQEPDTVTLREEGGNTYVGTASFGSKVLDVRVHVTRRVGAWRLDAIEWKPRE